MTHSLRYCLDCKRNTCCAYAGGLHVCKFCGGTAIKAFHPTRQYLNAIRRKAEMSAAKKSLKKETPA